MLLPYLPDGLELDGLKDHAFVSLVAFDFLHTRIKGVPIPFHQSFPEVNLRFYVHQKDEAGNKTRGVVFIKELVPKRAVSAIAQNVYNEPYAYVPMRSESREEGNEIIIDHELHVGGRKHQLTFYCNNEPYYPETGSTEHYFKEHEWGFGKNKKGELLRYRVEHPQWRVYPLEKRFKFDLDFGALYGPKWSFLITQIPYNILVAEGSKVKVFPAEAVPKLD